MKSPRFSRWPPSPGAGGLGVPGGAGRAVPEGLRHKPATQAPTAWPSRFATSDWGIFIAQEDSEQVGGVTVATPAAGIIVTEGRSDTAALWDIRVAPSRRRGGIGMGLLQHAARWAGGEGFEFLAIETTNVNVPACRLYAKAGAELSEVRRFGYEGCPEVAHESMIVWRMRPRTPRNHGGDRDG